MLFYVTSSYWKSAMNVNPTIPTITSTATTFQIPSTTFRFFALNIICIFSKSFKTMWYYYEYNTSKIMREYQQKHMFRTLVYSRVTLVILFLLIVLLLRSIVELNTKRMDVAKLRDDSTYERIELQKKVTTAQTQTDLINTKRGLEAYIRTTYPVVKKGEGVIVIYDDNKVPVSTVRKNMTMWEHVTIWWNNFFSKN